MERREWYEALPAGICLESGAILLLVHCGQTEVALRINHSYYHRHMWENPAVAGSCNVSGRCRPSSSKLILETAKEKNRRWCKASSGLQIQPTPSPQFRLPARSHQLVSNRYPDHQSTKPVVPKSKSSPTNSAVITHVGRPRLHSATPKRASDPRDQDVQALSSVALAVLNQGPRVWALTGLSLLSTLFSQARTHVVLFIGSCTVDDRAARRDATADFWLGHGV